MRKKVLLLLLAVGFAFSCVTTEADAKCAHNNTRTVIERHVTGGYYHTYKAPGGITKGCGVTVGTTSARTECTDCGEVLSSESGSFEEHNTNHD